MITFLNIYPVRFLSMIIRMKENRIKSGALVYNMYLRRSGWWCNKRRTCRYLKFQRKGYGGGGILKNALLCLEPASKSSTRTDTRNMTEVHCPRVNGAKVAGRHPRFLEGKKDWFHYIRTLTSVHSSGFQKLDKRFSEDPLGNFYCWGGKKISITVNCVQMGNL